MGKKNNASEGDVLYSLREFEDGKRFVDVQADVHVFDGMTVSQMNKAVKPILMERFAGKVIGIDHRAFVNGDSVNEYLHPSKSIDIDTRKAKLAAAGELDNLLDAGTALPNEPDGRDGHIHPGAIDFSYFKTIFKVGNEYFEGLVNIKNIKRGKLFKDVTQIRNITQDIVSSYGQNPKSNFLRDASMDSIRNPEPNVNPQKSDRGNISTRSILTELDASAVTNEIERKHSLEYQEHSRGQLAEQEKLQKLQADLKELESAQGKKDVKRIRFLKDEKIKTENRIKNYEGMLRREEYGTYLEGLIQREVKAAVRRAVQKKDPSLGGGKRGNDPDPADASFDESIYTMPQNKQDVKSVGAAPMGLAPIGTRLADAVDAYGASRLRTNKIRRNTMGNGHFPWHLCFCNYLDVASQLRSMRQRYLQKVKKHRLLQEKSVLWSE